MGLFDFLSGKKKAAVPEPAPAPKPAPVMPPGLSAWQEQLWQAEHGDGFAWRDDNERARALVRALLAHAAKEFGDGKVVNNSEPPPVASAGSVLVNQFGDGLVSEADHDVELRGLWGSLPIRIPVSIPARKLWAIEVRCAEKGRYFKVLRDPTRIPAPADASDPWARSKRGCIFLGKGVFIDDSVDEMMQGWALDHWVTLPAAAQELVVQAMDRLDLRVVQLDNAGGSLLALGNPTLDQLADPIAYMRDVAAFLAELVQHLGASAAARPTTGTRYTCGYCTSIFVLAPGKNTCPNCGAPATAT